MSTSETAGKVAGIVALVTHADTETGAAIVLALAATGGTVFLHCTDEKQRAAADSTATKAQVSASCTTHVVVGDLATERGCLEVHAAVLALTDHLDLLVNGTHNGDGGLLLPETPLLGDAGGFDWQGAMRTFAGNAMALTKLTALCVPLLENSKQPAVVNIAHNAMRFAYGARRSVWAGSLAAIDAMTRYHALELAPKIRVNCVSAGYSEPEWSPSVPMQRPVAPTDIAHAVLYVASEPFVTGQTIDVNGGVFCH